MSKKIRNLLSEIEKKFKDSEEGIQIIDALQLKLENAPTQNQKEKYEQEMKKEIKKLQRLRDFFRSNQNNPDIKDKSKLD
jgi:CCR4-NOT transcription complex subunit 3